MLSLCLLFVSTGAYTFTPVLGKGLQSGMLVTVGCILFALGTVLRSKLPRQEEKPTSNPRMLTLDMMRPKPYTGTVAAVANAAASRIPVTLSDPSLRVSQSRSRFPLA